ncbi:unnamed protein product [Adineta steineri]|uniref:catechol O-methyltransferase n=1 Tax=Adineta steineri TaxID=433720 RepID=A0A814ZCT1_9BILA|nr:unnamed protein product [Adineta steineri]CAF1143933.1 unnamed protein product [Adineta steineri]CAF1241299.1 unnamed protein product [Adineta steineri]
MQSSHLTYVNYVLENSQPGNIQSVIDAVDKYGWTKQWLMSIGDRKGVIIDKAIQSRKPKTILELGTFLGYSSLRMAAQIPNDTLIFSIEIDPELAKIAHAIHEHAGVGDRIKILIGSSENVIPQLSKQYHINSFDFIFIDHGDSIYLRDLKLLERLGLIQPGTMIVADNVITPGAPDYLYYIQNNPNYQTRTQETVVQYQEEERDGIEITIRN